MGSDAAAKRSGCGRWLRLRGGLVATGRWKMRGLAYIVGSHVAMPPTTFLLLFFILLWNLIHPPLIARDESKVDAELGYPTNWRDWLPRASGVQTHPYYGDWFIYFILDELMAHPIRSVAYILDVVALWGIACILWRQRRLTVQERAEKAAVPLARRTKGYWGLVHWAVRFTSLEPKAAAGAPPVGPHAACEKPCCGGGSDAAGSRTWRDAWEKVADARRKRKDTLLRVRFNLNAVLSRAAGPLLITVVTGLIVFLVHACVVFRYLHPKSSPFEKNTLFVITPLFGWRIFYDYLSTILTAPGRPEAGAGTEMEHLTKGDTPTEVENGYVHVPDPTATDVAGLEGGEKKRERPRWCKECKAPKPARTHHCKVCQACVLKMDHHCPFVGTCVGEGNYRFFMQFVLCAGTASTIEAVLLIPTMCPVWWGFLFADNNGPMALHYTIHLTLATLGAILVASSLMPFGLFHVQMALNNETTLERMKKQKEMHRSRRSESGTSAVPRNPYDLGHAANFSEIFGNGFICQRIEALVECLFVPAGAGGEKKDG